MPSIMIEVDESTHARYLRLKQKLKAKRRPETIKGWFARRVEEYDRRLWLASRHQGEEPRG